MGNNCAHCKYLKVHRVCGCSSSGNYGRKVTLTDRCEYFDQNPAGLHYSRGLALSFKERWAEAKQEFELAL